MSLVERRSRGNTVMIKKLFRRNFEQNQYAQLPPKASRIVQSVARDFLVNGHLSPKQVEIAHAVLHMRLYQQFGSQSSFILPIADTILNEMTELPTPVPA
jgi:hypothetical protein